MGERELIIFIVIANLILLVFITGIILFIFQFRRRKIAHETEKEQLAQIHKEELLNNQIEIQTQTMKTVGREIHDNVGQKLTLASIYANQIDNSSPKVEQISKLLNESIQDLRQLSKSLVQPHLAQSDLVALLNEEATQINISGFTKLKIVTNVETLNLDFERKNAIFRILQEFIQNSLKHANCKQILVKIEKNNEKISISIEDNGKGFDTSTQSNGIGLSNMKRRASEIGADFELNSEVDNGTKMLLNLSLFTHS